MGSLPEAAYLMVITRRNASEILLLPAGAGWKLPRLEVNPGERLAEQLTSEVLRAWGMETVCLFSPPFDRRCMVMEPVRDNEKSPPGTYWTPRTSADRCCAPPEAAAIRESLAELDGYARAQAGGHFACCGWLRELFRWVQEQVGPRGLQLTGRFRQLNTGPQFCLVRFETSGQAVWFKATGAPNRHEMPVTVTLGRLFPNYLPEILAVHREWNGWLSSEAPGTSLDAASRFRAWERAAEDLAGMQISSIGKTDELLASGCRDLRVPALAQQIDAFLACMNELMAAQKKPAPAPLDRSELRTLALSLREACTTLQSFSLPDTIGHTDFNPGNIFVGQDRCVFLDWSEAAVSNPVLTFQYLREYLPRSGMNEAAGGEKLSAVYSQRWSTVCSANEIRKALAQAPLVAVFAYALSTDSWRSIDRASDCKTAAYYRSLARRMYREAVKVAQRSELCLD
ncbi:MAG TPA: phosphotransferase [Terriglobales bacterium]|nr:phosphotransferase [Terriglobales bacterium]